LVIKYYYLCWYQFDTKSICKISGQGTAKTSIYSIFFTGEAILVTKLATIRGKEKIWKTLCAEDWVLTLFAALGAVDTGLLDWILS
jgi:hypothetical protein